jgi:hypothetical protein
MYDYELKRNVTTESDISASYLNSLLNVDSNGSWQLHYMTNLMTLTLQSSTFPFTCTNIPLSSAYGVYISQFIQCARACFSYKNFLNQGQLLTKKLMLQDYTESREKSSFRKSYGRYNDLVCDYNLSLCWIICFIPFVILPLTTEIPCT